MVHGNWGHPRRRAKALLNTWATAGEPFPMSAGVGNNFWSRPGIAPPTSQSTGHLGCERPASLPVYHTGPGASWQLSRGQEPRGSRVGCGLPTRKPQASVHTAHARTPAWHAGSHQRKELSRLLPFSPGCPARPLHTGESREKEENIRGPGSQGASNPRPWILCLKFQICTCTHTYSCCSLHQNTLICLQQGSQQRETRPMQNTLESCFQRRTII